MAKLGYAIADAMSLLILREAGHCLVEGTILSASGPTDYNVVCAPKSWTLGRKPGPMCSSQNSVYSSSVSHMPAKTPNWLHPQTRNRNETIHPDQIKQLTVFTWRMHLLFTPTLPLIRSPLLSIAPQDFDNTSLRHTQNSIQLTLTIALCWKQDALWHISRQSALGSSPKMTEPGLFLFGVGHNTQTRSVEKIQNRLDNQSVKLTPIHFEI